MSDMVKTLREKMNKSGLEIYKEKKLEKALDAYIEENGGDVPDWSDWYCGITYNVSERLKQHEIKKKIKIKLRTRVKCSSMESAVDLEKKMHDKGCVGDGGPGNPADDAEYVYVFKIK